MTDRGPPVLPSPRGGHRALVEAVPNGVLVLFDADLRYRIVGPSVLPFSGREAAEMVGSPVHELFPPETVTVLEPELRATLDGDSRSFDVTYGDEIHHIETRPTRLDGERYGVLLTQAVTENRETERELAEKNERLEEFASMVAHDVRSPISVALANLELYRVTGDESKLDELEEKLSRIAELTTGLATLARYGEPSEDYGPISLGELARDAWGMIDARSATLSVEDGTIEGDTGQLQALFENLFRNAVGHGGYDVTVRVGPLEGGFYVEDTGTGIPEAERDQVFEHGYSTGYGGSGVGLAIVRRIASAHDLAVTVTESDEGGAQFEFRRTDDAWVRS